MGATKLIAALRDAADILDGAAKAMRDGPIPPDSDELARAADHFRQIANEADDRTFQGEMLEGEDESS